jgi:hypothetical protein
MRTYLIAAALCIPFVAYAKAPRDFNNDQHTKDWFAGAKQHNGTSCCGDADAYREGELYAWQGKEQIVFDAWEMRGNEYWVKVLGAWHMFGKEGNADIVHGNPTGRAVIWMRGNYASPLGTGGESRPNMLCFAPGMEI